MKIVIAQTNPTPGDFAGNVDQIIKAIQAADVDKDIGGINGGPNRNYPKLVVTPELSIPGYLCRDSMLTEGFVEENLKGLSHVVQVTAIRTGITVVVGYVEKNRTGVGKPFFNSAAVVRDGAIVANYRKRLLPFYDVFDEGRYFEPGKDLAVIDIDGTKWGIVICEDAWNDKDVDDYRYEDNPVDRYRRLGVRNLISLNSSPYIIGKPAARQRMLSNIAAGDGVFIYANQVGGMDDLVFDGNSMVIIGGTNHYSCGNKEGAHIIDLSKGYGFQSHDWDGPQEIRNNLRLGLRDYVVKSKFSDVVVASSGGIDSALVLALACDAIGPSHVHAIRMPGEFSSKGSVDDALELHKNLGCHDYLMPIDNKSLTAYMNRAMLGNTGDGTALGTRIADYRKVADENDQARLRAINLMHFSNAWGMLALTTGNKSENATGYCTLGGDMMGGFAPIQDLYKMQVYQVSRLYAAGPTRVTNLFEAIPMAILEKAPSAELAPGQTDEAALLPYRMLDLIICGYVERGVATIEGFRKLGAETFGHVFPAWNKDKGDFLSRPNADAEFKRIVRLIDLNEFKRRQAAPGIKVSRVAFGTGRRFPIVRRRWV